MNKAKIKYGIVVLVYRNFGDLEECLDSIKNKILSYKVVIVNAFYDEFSSSEIQKISKEYNSDFLEIENKGYSFGNNKGIEFLDEHYSCEYFIVSNPDIIVKEFIDTDIKKEFQIIAPDITTLSGKKQNPMQITRSKLSEYFIYEGFKKNNKLLISMGVFVTAIRRRLHIMVHGQKCFQIYSAHGSFVLISHEVYITLGKKIYDEDMFLFAEEGVLAYKAKHVGLKTYYYPQIKIMHKEDGSMKLSDLPIDGELKKANIYYYENYVMKKKK